MSSLVDSGQWELNLCFREVTLVELGATARGREPCWGRDARAEGQSRVLFKRRSPRTWRLADVGSGSGKDGEATPIPGLVLQGWGCSDRIAEKEAVRDGCREPCSQHQHGAHVSIPRLPGSSLTEFPVTNMTHFPSRGLKTTEMCSPGAGGQKSEVKVSQGRAPSGGSRGGSFPPLPAPGGPRCSLHLHHPSLCLRCHMAFSSECLL